MSAFNAFAKGLVGGFSTGTKAWARYQENQQRATQMEAQAEVGEKFKKFYAERDANAAIPPPADAAGVATGKAAAAANEPEIDDDDADAPVPESVAEASGAGMDGGAIDTPEPAEGVSVEAPSPDVPATGGKGEAVSEAIAETGGVKGIAAKDPDDIAQMASDVGAATGANEKNAPPTGKSWYTLMQSVERSYFSRGLVKQGIAAREALAGRMTKGYADNLKRANSAMSSKDLHGVARYMTKAQTFSPDGTTKRYTVENGKVVETSISEKTGKAVGRNEVTSENMKSRIANTLTGKEYLEHSDRATNTNIRQKAQDIQASQFWTNAGFKKRGLDLQERGQNIQKGQFDRKMTVTEALANNTIGDSSFNRDLRSAVFEHTKTMDRVNTDLKRQGLGYTERRLRIQERMEPLDAAMKQAGIGNIEWNQKHQGDVLKSRDKYQAAMLEGNEEKIKLAQNEFMSKLELWGAQTELAKAKADAAERSGGIKLSDLNTAFADLDKVSSEAWGEVSNTLKGVTDQNTGRMKLKFKTLATKSLASNPAMGSAAATNIAAELMSPKPNLIRKDNGEWTVTTNDQKNHRLPPETSQRLEAVWNKEGVDKYDAMADETLQQALRDVASSTSGFATKVGAEAGTTRIVPSRDRGIPTQDPGNKAGPGFGEKPYQAPISPQTSIRGIPRPGPQQGAPTPSQRTPLQ